MKVTKYSDLSQQNINLNKHSVQRVSFTSPKLITISTDSTLHLYNIPKQVTKAFPTHSDLSAFSPDNRFLALSRKDTIYFFPISSGLSDLSDSAAQTSFSVPGGIITWLFLSPGFLLILTHSSILEYSLPSNSASPLVEFSALPNSPSLSGLAAFSLSHTPDKRDFAVAGTISGAPVSFIISLSLNRIVRTPSSHAVVSSLNGNTCFLMTSGPNVQKIEISNGAPSRETINCFSSAETVSFISLPPGASAATFYGSEGEIKAVDLASKQTIAQLSPSDTNISGTVISTIRIDFSSTFLLTDSGCLYTQTTPTSSQSSSFSSSQGVNLTQSAGAGETGPLTIEKVKEMANSADLKQLVKRIVAENNNKFRTEEVITIMKQATPGPDKVPLFIKYLFDLVSQTTLNELESLELVAAFIAAKKEAAKPFLQEWWSKGRLTQSEKLGDLLKEAAPLLSLEVYDRINHTPKYIGTLVSLGKLEEVLSYAAKKNFSPDYAVIFNQIYLLVSTKALPPSKAKELAALLLKQSLLSLEKISLLMLENKDNSSYLELMTRYFKAKGDREEDSALQTKFLEVVARDNPAMLVSLLQGKNTTLTHFDRETVAANLEGSPDPKLALLCYKSPADIKRVLSSVLRSGVETAFLTNYFSSYLAASEGNEVMPFIAALISENEGVSGQLGQVYSSLYKSNKDRVDPSYLISEMGSKQTVSFLAPLMTASKMAETPVDSPLVFSYIQACVQSGSLDEAKNIILLSKDYDPVQVKDFLLSLQRDNENIPEIILVLCHEHKFYSELVSYLYASNKKGLLLSYMKKKNPAISFDIIKYSLEVGLPDAEISEVIGQIDLGSSDLLGIINLLEERAKSNLIVSRLENNSNNTKEVKSALALIYIKNKDGNARKFIEQNKGDLNLANIGEKCSDSYPLDALFLFSLAREDDKVLALTNNNGFFSEQADYIAERADLPLYQKAIGGSAENRVEVVEILARETLSKKLEPAPVSVGVKAFMEYASREELLKLLDTLVTKNSNEGISNSSKLQTLLIVTAIAEDPRRVVGYLEDLSQYDPVKVGEKLQEHSLFEEAVTVYSKNNSPRQCVKILLEDIGDFRRATTFVEQLEPKDQGEAEQELLLSGMKVKELAPKTVRIATEKKKAFLLNEVISYCWAEEEYALLKEYLLSIKPVCQDPLVDKNILLVLLKKGVKEDIEQFVNSHRGLNLHSMANDSLSEGNYAAAAVLFEKMQRFDPLAKCYLHLRELEKALEAAKKSGSTVLLKELLGASLEAGNREVYMGCAALLTEHADTVEFVFTSLEVYGLYQELIESLERAAQKESPAQAVFPHLSVAYAKYGREKLLPFLEQNWRKLTVPVSVKVFRSNGCWKEAVYLYFVGGAPDSALRLMAERPGACLDRETVLKCFPDCVSTECMTVMIELLLELLPSAVEECLGLSKLRVDPRKLVAVAGKNDSLFLVDEYVEQHCKEKKDKFSAEYLLLRYIETEQKEKLSDLIGMNLYLDYSKAERALLEHERIDFKRMAARLGRRRSMSVCDNDDKIIQAEVSAYKKDIDVVRENVKKNKKENLSELSIVSLCIGAEWMKASDVIYLAHLSGYYVELVPLVSFCMKRQEEEVEELRRILKNEKKNVLSESDNVSKKGVESLGLGSSSVGSMSAGNYSSYGF